MVVKLLEGMVKPCETPVVKVAGTTTLDEYVIVVHGAGGAVLPPGPAGDFGGTVA